MEPILAPTPEKIILCSQLLRNVMVLSFQTLSANRLVIVSQDVLGWSEAILAGKNYVPCPLAYVMFAAAARHMSSGEPLEVAPDAIERAAQATVGGYMRRN